MRPLRLGLLPRRTGERRRWRDRVYVAVRQMSRDGRPTRARLGLDAQTARKRIAVFVADHRKPAGLSREEELHSPGGLRPPFLLPP